MDLKYIILTLYGLLVTPSEDGVVTQGGSERRAGSAGIATANSQYDHRLDDQLIRPNRW